MTICEQKVNRWFWFVRLVLHQTELRKNNRMSHLWICLIKIDWVWWEKNEHDSISFFFLHSFCIILRIKINSRCHFRGWCVIVCTPLIHRLSPSSSNSTKSVYKKSIPVWIHTFTQITLEKKNEWKQTSRIIRTGRYSYWCKSNLFDLKISNSLFLHSHSLLYPNMIVLIWVIKRIFYSILIKEMMINNHHAHLATNEKKIGHV